MNRFQKTLVWVTSALTGGTGIVYFVMDRMLEPVGPWAVVNHPWQPWVLKVHIIVAPALVFSIGLIASQHIWKHFRSRVSKARRTGLTTMCMIGPMVFSGYLIQAITQQTLLSIIAWCHVVTGVVYLIAVGLHQWAFRAVRVPSRRLREPEVQPPSRERLPNKAFGESSVQQGSGVGGRLATGSQVDRRRG